MRIKPAELEEITGMMQAAAQARWFKTHFGVSLPVDGYGPIITRGAFEKLVEKSCGLKPVEARPHPELKTPVKNHRAHD